MANASGAPHRMLRRSLLLSLVLSLWPATAPAGHNEAEAAPGARLEPYPTSELDLVSIPFKIVYETRRETDGRENWELYLVDADGHQNKEPDWVPIPSGK